MFVDGDVITLLINAFAYCFKEARLSTTGGSDIKHNEFCGQISTIVRLLTSSNRYLFFHFHKIDEPQAQIQSTSFKHLLINNHDVAANKSKTKGQLALEHNFRFCRTTKKSN